MLCQLPACPLGILDFLFAQRKGRFRPSVCGLLPRLLAHFPPLFGKILPQPGVLFVCKLRRVHVPLPDLHGNVLLRPVPVLVIGVL